MRSSRLDILNFAAFKEKLRPESVVQFFFLIYFVAFHPHFLRAQAAAQVGPAGSRTIRGVVKSGNMPIPGAEVSAENVATKQQFSTWTDVDGSYSLRIPADGRYTLRVQMTAFAASAQEVVLDETHPDIQANFELILLSRAREATNKIEQRQANAAADEASRVFPCFRVERGKTRLVAP